MTGDNMPTESGAVVAMLAATGEPVSEFATFFGALVEQQRRDYAYTTSTLIDNLSAEVATLRATLECISLSMEALMRADYMPGPAALARCLYPSREAVEARMAWHLAQGGTHSSTYRKEGS